MRNIGNGTTALRLLAGLVGLWLAVFPATVGAQTSDAPEKRTASAPVAPEAARSELSGSIGEISGSAIGTLAPDLDQRRIAKKILFELQKRHLQSKQIDDTFSGTLLDTYLDNLDHYRRYFLASDIGRFERFRFSLDEAAIKGDLAPGFEIYQTWLERRLQAYEHLSGLLETEFDTLRFDVDESLSTQRDKGPWLASEEEFLDLWRRYFKNDVLNLRLSEVEPEEIKRILKERYDNQIVMIKQSNSADAFRTYMSAFTSQYDPHTEYFPPRKAENFDIEMSLSLEGIGALLEPYGEYTRIVRIIPGGPAEKDGRLQPSDRIIAVAQGVDGEWTNVVGWRLDDVVDRIRGPKGSTIRLEVLPAEQSIGGETTVINLIRDEVKLEEQAAESKVIEVSRGDHNYTIGVIELPAFYIDFEDARRAQQEGRKTFTSSSQDVRKLIDSLEKDHKVDGIVVDLRNNGGGSLYEARELTGLFQRRRPVVEIRDVDNQVEVQVAGGLSPYYDGPLAVMINRLSASASEIFAGAVQDYGRGLLIGTPTFGKGTVQNLGQVEDGQIKLTQAKFYRVTGESTQVRGVEPDIMFPQQFDPERIGESALDRPLPWDKIPSVPGFEKNNMIARSLGKLRELYEKRVASDPDFQFLVDWFAYRNEVSNNASISLNEEKRKAERKADEARRLAIENKRRAGLGKEPLASFDDLDDEDDDRPGPDEADAFARQAAESLVDLIEIERGIRTVKR